jgi:hypothetical protein
MVSAMMTPVMTGKSAGEKASRDWFRGAVQAVAQAHASGGEHRQHTSPSRYRLATTTHI